MNIECLEEELKFMLDDQLVIMSKGDVKNNFPDDMGEQFCVAGWVKDLDGSVETGTRKPGAGGEIEPAAVVQSQG